MKKRIIRFATQVVLMVIIVVVNSFLLQFTDIQTMVVVTASLAVYNLIMKKDDWEKP